MGRKESRLVKTVLLGLEDMVKVMEWGWCLLLGLMLVLTVDLVGWVLTVGTREDHRRII